MNKLNRQNQEHVSADSSSFMEKFFHTDRQSAQVIVVLYCGPRVQTSSAAVGIHRDKEVNKTRASTFPSTIYNIHVGT